MSDKKHPRRSNVIALPGGRIPLDHSDAIRMAFLDGRLRWGSDLERHDVTIRSAPVPAIPAMPGGRRGQLVTVTVGEVVEILSARHSRRKLDS